MAFSSKNYYLFYFISIFTKSYSITKFILIIFKLYQAKFISYNTYSKNKIFKYFCV